MKDENEREEIETRGDAANPVNVLVRLPISEYDPNKRCNPQTVRVVVQQWEYSKVFEVEVGGNCLGFDIFDSAVETVMDDIHLTNMGEHANGIPYVELKNNDGDTLLCEGDDDKWEQWLKEMVTSVEIISQSDEKAA